MKYSAYYKLRLESLMETRKRLFKNEIRQTEIMNLSIRLLWIDLAKLKING